MIDLTQKRILIVDDNEAIHQDFRKVLDIQKQDAPIDKMTFDIMKDKNKISFPTYIIESAFQGQEALKMVEESLAREQPFALAFVDIRMPPGWHGIETIQQIWNVDPAIQIVICTAYSDFSWKELLEQLKFSDNFLILKKPFDPIEIRQIATALTKKWELKHQVQQQIDSLESTIQNRTAELLIAKDIAEKANQLKSDFLRNISHELRVPLNSIIGFSELIGSNHEISLEDCLNYSRDITACGYQLAQMIGDMLDIAKFESGKVEFLSEKIDLNRVVNAVLTIYQKSIKEKLIQLDVKVDPTLTNIMGDPIKLQQVLFHFLSNAIKFSAEKSKINVNVFPINTEFYRIEVSDTGIGIPEENFPKLFMPFQQLDLSMSKRYPGAGIGLSLVRHIVEAQGGKVGVKSEVNKGSTFFVVLPIKHSI